MKEMEDAFNVDLSNVPEASRDKMLKAYISDSHDGAWKKANTQTSEENAHQRKRLEEEKAEFIRKRSAFVEEQKLLKREKEQLAKEKERQTKLASKVVTKDTIYDEDGRTDPDKLYEYNQARQAKENLERIGERESVIQEREQALQQEQARAENDRLLAELKTFQLDHPEYATERTFEDTYKLYERDRSTLLTDPDVEKLLEIFEIRDYADSASVPMEIAFQHLVKKGRLSVKATMPSNSLNQSTPSAESDKLREKFEALKRKQSGAQFLSQDGGTPSRPQPGPKQTLASKIRAHSGASSGGNAALSEMNY
jgi:hypothetical protein